MRQRPKIYSPEFIQQIVELMKAGKGVTELSREFECPMSTIRQWWNKARENETFDGPQNKTLCQNEREELIRLRKENRTLKQERDILAKATAWFANNGMGKSGPSMQ